VFDDSFYHSAGYGGTEARIVLIADIPHPELLQAAIETGNRTAVVDGQEVELFQADVATLLRNHHTFHSRRRRKEARGKATTATTKSKKERKSSRRRRKQQPTPNLDSGASVAAEGASRGHASSMPPKDEV